MRWIPVTERLPDELIPKFLRCIYPNGNECRAVGSVFDGRWAIVWSDDHPDGKDVAYWLDDASGVQPTDGGKR